MTLNSFKMMMQSGVLRPGYLEIRRIPVGPSPYSSNHVPQFMEHLLGATLRPVAMSNQVASTERGSRSHETGFSPAHPIPRNFSISTALRWLGILSPANRELRREPPSPQMLISRLRERVRNLESLLMAERARCQTQGDELARLCAQVARVEQLQAELCVEQESGRQLVQWLQEAEQKLGDNHSRHLGVTEGSYLKYHTLL